MKNISYLLFEDDKIVIDGVTYGTGAKAGLAPRIGKTLHSFLLLHQTDLSRLQ